MDCAEQRLRCWLSQQGLQCICVANTHQHYNLGWKSGELLQPFTKQQSSVQTNWTKPGWKKPISVMPKSALLSHGCLVQTFKSMATRQHTSHQATIWYVGSRSCSGIEVGRSASYPRSGKYARRRQPTFHSQSRHCVRTNQCTTG